MEPRVDPAEPRPDWHRLEAAEVAAHLGTEPHTALNTRRRFRSWVRPTRKNRPTEPHRPTAITRHPRITRRRPMATKAATRVMLLVISRIRTTLSTKKS